MTPDTTVNDEFDRFNVPEFNIDTEADVIGDLEFPISLLPGLAETVLKNCSEPDVVFRRILNDEDEWVLDESLSVSVYYPGNSLQTSVAAVEKTTDEVCLVDYYQVPYGELVPIIKLTMKSRQNTDERWFISQLNNAQLEGWFEESGVMRMSNCALKKLENENEAIRNKYCSGVEQRQERADD